MDEPAESVALNAAEALVAVEPLTFNVASPVGNVGDVRSALERRDQEKADHTKLRFLHASNHCVGS